MHVPMPAMRSATVMVYIGLGSRFEPPRDAGVSHLLEHMLFKGTLRRRTAADISATLDGVGGILNGSTDKEATVYWAKVAHEYLPLAVDLLADMLRNSRLAPADVTKEKRVVLEELSMIADDPQDWVHTLTDEVLWPDQPLGREVAGTPESVRRLRRREVCRYFEGYYGANNAVISVAGGTDFDTVQDLVGQQFGDWAAAIPGEPVGAFEPIHGSPRFRVEHKETEQVNICLAYPGIPRNHPDQWAMDLLCTILGGGTSSRLFIQLRERMALVYDVHAYPTYFHDTGSVVVYSGMERSRTDSALDGILREIDRLQRRRVPDSELQRAKQYYRGRLSLGLEDSHAVASWFGSQEMLQHEVVTPEAAADAVCHVTSDDLLRVARTYLTLNRVRFAAVGPVARSALEARLT